VEAHAVGRSGTARRAAGPTALQGDRSVARRNPLTGSPDDAAAPLDVVHLTRRPHPHQRSIELVFETVRAHLPPEVAVRVVTSSHYSSGVVPRLRAVLEARRLQGRITHVVGDIHYVTLLMRRRSTVLTVHDVEFLDRAGRLKRLLYGWLWLRLPVARSAVVTVPSEGSRQALVSTLGQDPGVRVVPNPLRPGFVPARPSAGPGPPQVLLMGTWPNKNLPRSAEALRGLPVQVVLIGPVDDQQRALLDDAVPGWAHHAGPDDDGVVQLIRECHLLLFPSLHEGFGLPIIEAQATGRPVVTSDRPPMSEVAGGAAVLVDPEDVGSIRAGVLRVLEDAAAAEDLVRRGLVNVERFSPSAVAAQYAAIYTELANAE
jgi:glycosyltransferase involved in cell wall biosynthesis